MQELFEDINAIRRGLKALNKRLQEQGQPVSQAQVAQLLQEASKAPTFTLDLRG